MNPWVLLNHLAALMLGIAAVSVAYRLQRIHRHPFLADYVIFLMMSAVWGFVLWTIPGLIDAIRSVSGATPAMTRLPMIAKWFGFPFHLIQLYFLVLMLGGLHHRPVERTFKGIYLAASTVLLVILFGALLNRLGGGNSRIFSVLHAQTTNAYLIFQALAYVGSGLLAAKIPERDRRRTIAGFSWLYLTGFAIYFVMTNWVIPNTLVAPWLSSANHWPPLILLIAALRQGVIERVPAPVSAPPEVFSPRFEWTERERDILDGLLAGRTNRQLAKDLFLSHQTVSSGVQ